MDIERTKYFTIVQFGTKDVLMRKLAGESCTLDDIKDLRDDNGVSLFEKSLSFRNFDISQALLEKNVEVNVVSKDKCNELHYLAANIESRESVSIAEKLIELGVDLNLQDKKYGNTPFWYLCDVAIRKNQEYINNLVRLCVEKGVDIDIPNKISNTTRNMIMERGTKELKAIVL